MQLDESQKASVHSKIFSSFILALNENLSIGYPDKTGSFIVLFGIVLYDIRRREHQLGCSSLIIVRRCLLVGRKGHHSDPI